MIVHLDLKGAPLAVPYLEKVILNAKLWGATGVLIEWEDTFPYSGDLVDIGSVAGGGGDDMYTMDEVRHILQFCKMNGLEAIQLIQTIGHMEFVLKHPQFSHLREWLCSPAVLCPSKVESQALVEAMLQQTLDVQPDATYFHIGADEVWYTGVCAECQNRIKCTDGRTNAIFLEHVRKIALYIKAVRPNLSIVMWDDMLRPVGAEVLKFYNLGDLVQPMVWDYNVQNYFRISPAVWSTYQQVFPKVWAASAFKGANGSSQIVSTVSRYMSNHEAWLAEISKYPTINFAGVALTGWSRYDHYATLCELMPVSLPSLANCLKILATVNDRPNVSLMSEDLPPGEWPGMELAHCIRYFIAHRDYCQGFLDSDLVTNWCTPWHLERKYTNPAKIKRIADKTNELLKELLQVKNDLTTLLSEITGKRSTEEWVHTYVMPIVSKLSELSAATEQRSKIDASVIPALPYPVE